MAGESRSALGRSLTGRFDGVLVIGALIALWESAAVLGLRGVPTPFETARRLVIFTLSGDLWHHMTYTLASAATGFVLGAAPGIALPFAPHRHDTLKRVL